MKDLKNADLLNISGGGYGWIFAIPSIYDAVSGFFQGVREANRDLGAGRYR